MEDTSDLLKRLAIQEQVHGYQLDWIKAVDVKTSILIGIDLAMLGVLAAVAPATKDLTFGKLGILVLSSVPLAMSLVACLLATMPRLDGPEGSMIFFGGICKRTRDAHRAAARERADEERWQDVCDQTHQNAVIADWKYAKVRMGFYWLFASAPFWLISIYVLYREGS